MHIIFFAPQIAPIDNSAAAVRCRAIYDELINQCAHQKCKVELWTPSKNDILNSGLNFDQRSDSKSDLSSPDSKSNSISDSISDPKSGMKSETRLYLKQASNKSSLFRRLAFEILLGVELALRFIILKMKREQVVVLMSSPPYVTCLIAAFACDLLHIRYALDIRDPYPEVYFNQKIFSKNSLLGELQIHLAQQFYRNSEHVFTVTKGCQKIIDSYFYKDNRAKNTTDSKISVVRNGFVDRDFDDATVKKRNEFTCVFHGNLGLMQNIELLKDVIEKTAVRNSQIQFVVAGSGSKEHLLRSIQTSNFQFLGEVKQKDIPQLLMSCHIGLSFRPEDEYSSIAFPVKIYEYIGANIPIIATPACEAIQEIADLKMGFLFSNSEADLIVNKIIDLANSFSGQDPSYAQTLNQIQLHRVSYSRKTGTKFLVDHLLTRLI